MTTIELIWVVKKSVNSERTILNFDIGERDLLKRINYHRIVYIQESIRNEGLSSMRREWMQVIVNRRTSQKKRFTPTSAVAPGGRIATYDGLILARLQTNLYENKIDIVKDTLFDRYARETARFGGFVATSTDLEEIMISPMVDRISGTLIVSDPTMFMVDTDTGVREFDVESDPYPSDGEMNAYIIKKIMEEFGIRRDIGDEEKSYSTGNGGRG